MNIMKKDNLTICKIDELSTRYSHELIMYELIHHIGEKDTAERYYMMRHFSNIHVCFAEYIVEDDEMWKYTLDDDKYEAFKINGHKVMGYILLDCMHTKVSTKYKLVDWIETMVHKKGIASHMLCELEKRFGTLIIPQEIVKSSVGFWKKHMCIEYREDLIILENELSKESLFLGNGLGGKNELMWNELFDDIESYPHTED